MKQTQTIADARLCAPSASASPASASPASAAQPDPHQPDPPRPDTPRPAEPHALTPTLVAALHTAAAHMALPYVPVVSRLNMEGALLMTALTHIGAELHYEEADFHWTFRRTVYSRYRPIARLRRDEDALVAADFEGMFSFTLDDQRWLAARALVESAHGGLQQITVLGGPSLDALLALTRRLRAAEADLYDGQIQVYGGGSTVLQAGEVLESDLILPDELKTTLLAQVDSFHRMATAARGGDSGRQSEMDGRVGPAGRGGYRGHRQSRGLLLVGRPGTGQDPRDPPRTRTVP